MQKVILEITKIKFNQLGYLMDYMQGNDIHFTMRSGRVSKKKPDIVKRIWIARKIAYATILGLISIGFVWAMYVMFTNLN